MPGANWLGTSGGGVSYDNAPRPTGGPQIKAPSLPAGIVPGSGTPTSPTLKTTPEPLPKNPLQAATTPAKPQATAQAPAQTVAQEPTAPPSTAQKVWSGVETAGNNQLGYQAGKTLLQRAAPSMIPSAGTATSSLAMRVPAAYGAYALGDLAVSPVRAAMGYDNYQDLQQRGVHESYLSNAGSNLMRPGRAAIGMVDSAYNGTVGAVREFFRGRSLDQQRARQTAPRPTQPWTDQGAMTGGGNF